VPFCSSPIIGSGVRRGQDATTGVRRPHKAGYLDGRNEARMEKMANLDRVINERIEDWRNRHPEIEATRK